MNKDFILNTVDRISAEDLFKAIKTGVVTLDELKSTGKLLAPKRIAIEEILETEERKNADEVLEWERANQTNNVASYQYYLRLYPEGKYVSMAENKIEAIEENIRNNKVQLIQDLIENENNFTAFKIKELLRNNEITDDDLIDNGIITRKALKLFLNPPQVFHNLNEWSDLNALKKDRTDVYCFGIPGSGKSCLLAGLLYYANKKGLLKLGVDNIEGTKYANDLIRSVDIGYVPPSTPEKDVNYIDAGIYDSNENSHPLNIIEMSGELFSGTYKDASTSGSGTIGSNDYLQNNNRKVIFLIIDYKKSFTDLDESIFATQSAQLNMVLSLLEKDNTISKTDAIFLVLTKSDLLPGGEVDFQSANEFIENNYRALRRNVLRLKKENNFQSRILTFSLGRFMLGQTFEPSMTCSKLIFDALIETTYRGQNKSSSWTKKWFGR